MGNQITARAYNSFVIGRYNDAIITSSLTFWVGEDPLFVIGNRNSDPTRHNAVMVTKEGEVYLPDVYWDAVGAAYGDLLIDDTGKIGRLTSSRRYKKDINTMEDINWLYQLRPVNFIYKNDNTETKQYGLIAEEVEEVNPLFVSYNKEGEVEVVSYSKLVTLMLKALQEQEKQIDELKSENEDLKNRLSKLEELLMAK